VHAEQHREPAPGHLAVQAVGPREAAEGGDEVHVWAVVTHTIEDISVIMKMANHI
jgi:hypothetical protein